VSTASLATAWLLAIKFVKDALQLSAPSEWLLDFRVQ